MSPAEPDSFAWSILQMIKRVRQIIGIGKYSHLRGIDLAVFHCFVLHANRERRWQVQLTVETIARETRFSPSPVKKALKRLEAVELLVVHRRTREGYIWRLGPAVLEPPAKGSDRPFLEQQDWPRFSRPQMGRSELSDGSLEPIMAGRRDT
jgi:hypothetical protein